MNRKTRYEDRIKQLTSDLEGESDRAMIIIVTAHMDALLEDIIKGYLVPSPQASDQLFEGANSVFTSFSNKIDLAFRLGLISHSLAKSLHLIRRIRNKFAHNIGACSISDHDVISRSHEISKLTNIEEKNQEAFIAAEKKKKNARLFLNLLSIMATLEGIASDVRHRDQAALENIFIK